MTRICQFNSNHSKQRFALRNVKATDNASRTGIRIRFDFFKRRVCAYDRLSRGSLLVSMYARQNRSTRAPGVRSACHTSVPPFATDLGLSLGLGQPNVCLQRELALHKECSRVKASACFGAWHAMSSTTGVTLEIRRC